MVLLSDFSDMSNSRSSIVAPTRRLPPDQEYEGYARYSGHGGPGSSNARPLSFHDHRPVHTPPEINGFSKADNNSQSTVKLKTAQRSHDRKPAPLSPVVATHHDMVMINGFLVHRPLSTHAGRDMNGHSQNSDDRSLPRDSLARGSLKSASCAQFASRHGGTSELPPMLDLTQYKAKAVYISPSTPEYCIQKEFTDNGALLANNVVLAKSSKLRYTSEEGGKQDFRSHDTEQTQSNQSYSSFPNEITPNYASTKNHFHASNKDTQNNLISQRYNDIQSVKSDASRIRHNGGGLGLSTPLNGMSVLSSGDPFVNSATERLSYGTKFGSMSSLHERTSTYKPSLKSSSTYSIRDNLGSLLHHSGRSSTGTNDYLTSNSLVSTLPRRGSDQLRRTVSYEPNRPETKQTKQTSSDGEIESDYVTLDRHYSPFLNSRLGPVTEGVVQSVNALDRSLPLPHNDSNFYRNDIGPHASSTNLDPMHAPNNPLRSSKNMHALKTNLPAGGPQHRRKTNSGTLRAVAETLGSVFHSPRSSGSSSRGSGSPRSVNSFAGAPLGIDSAAMTKTRTDSASSQGLTRSKSLPDLQAAPDSSSNNYSDDEDGDDFGFLSYPISFSASASAAMNKAKSPSPGSRIFPKRWRNKTKASPSTATAATMWTPGPPGSCTWSSVSGRKVHLRPVSIFHLTEAERLALQKIALSKLQAMEIGCSVAIPKENEELQRNKRTSLSLKRRSKSASAPALEALGKDGSGQGLVFGIPLNKCIINDNELEKRCKRISCVKREGNENLSPAGQMRKSSSSSQGSMENSNQLLSPHNDLSSHKRAVSSDSLSESESSRNTSSSLIDALSLSTSNPSSRLGSLAVDGCQLANGGQAQVPCVVKACFKHIETYGLQTLGIFRVGCSKKRVKQLREEFDSGKKVVLSADHNPHDVAALLKEFFRDLPDPLLTRELYLPFLFAKRMKDEHKRHNALRLLISMLPVANRDTLWALLRFLASVIQHAADTTDEKGDIIPGNKMDSRNMAILFGPNILHRTKPTNDKETLAESDERVVQSKEIIEVVKDMIDNHYELFEISENLRDDVLRLLAESNQDVVDSILKFLANQNQIETDPESVCSVFEDSTNSPYLYHSLNSDADLLNYARKQSLTSHRPLRVTKSADNSLDSPISKSRATHLSESQAFSPSSKDNQTSVPPNITSPKYDMIHGFPNPLVGILPILKVSQDHINPEVFLRNKLDPSHSERPYSEGFNDNLNIPRPVYLRENSCSSISSGLSSSLNSQGGSDIIQSGQWVLPTPPTSRGSSPKPSFKSSLSSSTLTPSSVSPLIQHRDFYKQKNENNKPPFVTNEWEQWRQWEKMAAEKHNADAEQETLV